LHTTIVRPCNIYGPGQRHGRDGGVIPIFVHNALRGDDIVIRGTGEQSREFMFVSDLVDAYVEIIERDDLDGDVLNLTTHERVSIKTIADLVQSHVPTARIVHSVARPGDVSHFALDGGRALQRLKWRPVIRFQEGLAAYIEHAKTRDVR
jgi:nucleoside-diphosphate-sugar epimerase